MIPKLGLKTVEKMIERVIVKDDPRTMSNGYGLTNWCRKMEISPSA